jgi:hypothetical protein
MLSSDGAVCEKGLFFLAEPAIGTSVLRDTSRLGNQFENALVAGDCNAPNAL